MTLSRTDANLIAARLLADAELERERSARRHTAWLTILYPALKWVPPTRRVSVLRSASQRTSREPWIVLPPIVGLILFVALYLSIPRQLRPAWMNLLPGAITVGFVVAQYCRTRAILRAAAMVRSPMTK